MMPRKKQVIDAMLVPYLNELRELERSERTTIRPYGWSIRRSFRALIDDGRPFNPRRVRKEDVIWLRDEFIQGANRYRQNQCDILIGFLKWAGNPEASKWRITYGNLSPTRVRWLDDDQARLVRAEARGVERMIVHCELDLGMRRIELLRLSLSSFYRGKIRIHGKGRNGEKHRAIAYHPETESILEEYLHGAREKAIDRARERNPRARIPDALLVHDWYGTVRSYQKSGIDKILGRLGRRVGFQFTNHDLRRTCGRMMYRSGVRLEHIATIFGHSDTRTTTRYLGLDFDDMSEAMEVYATYQNSTGESYLGIVGDEKPFKSVYNQDKKWTEGDLHLLQASKLN